MMIIRAIEITSWPQSEGPVQGWPKVSTGWSVLEVTLTTSSEMFDKGNLCNSPSARGAPGFVRPVGREEVPAGLLQRGARYDNTSFVIGKNTGVCTT